jgi:hypothetical protein
MIYIRIFMNIGMPLELLIHIKISNFSSTKKKHSVAYMLTAVHTVNAVQVQLFNLSRNTYFFPNKKAQFRIPDSPPPGAVRSTSSLCFSKTHFKTVRPGLESGVSNKSSLCSSDLPHECPIMQFYSPFCYFPRLLQCCTLSCKPVLYSH